MKPYTACANFTAPKQGTNRMVVKVPRGFEVERIIAFIPITSTLDVRENGKSLIGQYPVGGGIFATSRRTLDLEAPYECQTTDVEVIVECRETPTNPLFIALCGTYEE